VHKRDHIVRFLKYKA